MGRKRARGEMKSMWISQAVQTVELLQHEADGHVHVAAAQPAETLPAGLRLVDLGKTAPSGSTDRAALMQLSSVAGGSLSTWT